MIVERVAFFITLFIGLVEAFLAFRNPKDDAYMTRGFLASLLLTSAITIAIYGL